MNNIPRWNAMNMIHKPQQLRSGYHQWPLQSLTTTYQLLHKTARQPHPQSKTVEDMIAWAAAHQNDPPHREKIERTPGDGRRNHGGPIWIVSKDGVLTEYGKKVEQERLAKLAATNENGEGKEAQSSS
jgi:hypothetical protein